MYTKTTLDKILNLFVSDEIRKNEQPFKQPFQLSDYNYSTDLKGAIRIKNEICEHAYNVPENIKNVLPITIADIFPQKTCEETLIINLSDFEKYKTEIKNIKQGEDIKCGLCLGSGTLETSDTHNAKIYYSEYDCPACYGTGYEVRSKLVDSGEKTFNYAIHVIHNTYFNMILFYNLIEISNILNAEIKLLHDGGPAKASLFQINEFDIVLMPIITESDKDINEIYTVYTTQKTK